MRVESTPRRVRFDTTGSDPQRRAPVNSTYAMSFSACAYALKCLIDPDLPVNDGFYRLVSLRRAGRGRSTNCYVAGPVVGGWETHAAPVEVISGRCCPAFPERLPAGSKGMMCQAGFGSLDVAAGKYTCFYDTFAGGYGGRYASDGPDAVQSHSQNTENAPIEETELNYPVRINGLSLVEDSEGRAASAADSGCGRTTSSTSTTTFTVLADRDKVGPWGVFGGHDGAVAEYVHVRDGVERGSARRRRSTRPGDVISVRTCGGGGYGPPEEREPERVLRDVLEGKVSAERAREVYGVAIADRRSTQASRREVLTRMSVRVAVDIGGTFTDATLIDEETGAVSIAKVLTTPADPVRGLHGGGRPRARERQRRPRRRSASSSTRRPWRRTRSSRARSPAAASSRPRASATCSRSRARSGRPSTTRSSRSRSRSSRATAR